MSREFPTSYERFTIRGEQLKLAVKNKLLATYLNLPTAFANHLEDLDIDWNIPRGSGEINSIGPALANSLRYACLSIDGKSPNKRPDTAEECEDLLATVLGDPRKATLFPQNIWRSPTSYLPLRGIPLQYIFRKEFADREFQTGDFGCGLNNMMVSINDNFYGEVPYRDKLPQGHINISLGVGIDKQKQNKENVLWALASDWGTNKSQVDKIYESVHRNTARFPFANIDLSKPDTRSQEIRDYLFSSITHTPFDAIVTSFMRYQLDQDSQTQGMFIQFINNHLRNGGVWIDMGKEMMSTNPIQGGYYSVDVYRKRNNILLPPQTPFQTAMNGKIMRVNLSYFQAA